MEACHPARDPVLQKTLLPFLLLMMRLWSCGQPGLTHCRRKQPRKGLFSNRVPRVNRLLLA